MMPETITITGEGVDISGAVLPNATFRIDRVSGQTVASGDAFSVAAIFVAVTDSSGTIGRIENGAFVATFDLVTGHSYRVTPQSSAPGSSDLRPFFLDIPDGSSSGTINDFIVPAPIPSLTLALEAQQAAQDWATGTTPGGPGTRSSREWAEQSEESADRSEGAAQTLGTLEELGEIADRAQLAADASFARSPVYETVQDGLDASQSVWCSDFETRQDLVDAIAAGVFYADGSTVTAGGAQYVFDSTADDPIPGMPGVVPGGTPHGRQFGAVLDGAADDTEAIRALHTYCNSRRIEPSYSGVTTFAVQANAQIEINTTVDFNGSVIVILDGIVSSPSWENEKSRAFIFHDPDCPVVAGEVSVDGAEDFISGSYTTSRGLIPSAGWLGYEFASGDDLPLLSDRSSEGTIPWRCCHKVYDNITTQYPLNINAVGVTSVFREYRLNSYGPITIRNFAVDVSRINEQIIFDIQRNEVSIERFRLFAGSDMPDSMVVEIVRPYKCADVFLSKPTGRSPSLTTSSYVFSPTWVANYRVEGPDFRQEAGSTWWWMAARWCNGMTYGPGFYDRIDVHRYSLNLFVEPGAKLVSRGVMIGHGGGLLVVDGATFYQTFSGWGIVQARTDYGRGSWDGEIKISRPTIVSAFLGNPLGAVIVNLPNVGNATIPIRLPRAITVTDVLVSRPTNQQDPMIITPFILAQNPTSAGVHAPASIVLDGVRCATRWSMYNLLDLANMLSPPTFNVDGVDIRISNAGPTHRNVDYPTIKVPAVVAANRVNIQCHYTVTDVDLLVCDIAQATQGSGGGPGSYMRVNGGSVSRVVAPTGLAIHYGDVDFRDPLLIGAETHAPLCGTKASDERYSTIAGGRVFGAFNLENFHAIGGLASRSGLDASLPSGVTREQLFTGWIA